MLHSEIIVCRPDTQTARISGPSLNQVPIQSEVLSENISSAMLRIHFFKWIESKILNCKPDSAAVQMLQRAVSESDFYFKLNATQKQKLEHVQRSGTE